MEFASMEKSHIDELFRSFENLLTEHNITFNFMRMTEENGVLSFDFCNNPEKARSVEFEGNNIIGLDTEYIAKEILMPILPRLKSYAKLK
ncbi:hypothetical protein [Bacillus massiliigorillae]|uniref:hypothetical protein n=1 Tax=Bacillus massiliigorillae TaxID=1243664 RepID=UPI0003A5E4CC|nr:hypothetical protein [Bacillus massiliigorillae]